MSLEEKPLPNDFTIDDDIASAIKDRIKNHKLPCAQVFIIAKAQNVMPLQVGQTADALTIHLSHCQLGLFGYPEHKQGWYTLQSLEDDALAEVKAKLSAVAENERLTCVQAWEIAKHLGVSKMHVGYVADQMGIRIISCQLGAF